jgi:uncharacterized protein
MNRIVFHIIFLFVSTYSVAQTPQVKLLAKVRNDSILLRWAPTDPIIWQYGNKYGYMVERYTIIRGGSTLLSNPIKVLLTSAPLKPQPLEKWRAAVERDDYAAIAAEAIFSSSFEVTKPTTNVFDVVNKTQEQEQRFSFALFAADHSFRAAQMSGLAMADANVKSDEKYLYRVYLFAIDSKRTIDSASFYIGLRDTVKLPPPTDVRAKFGNQTVKLSWPKQFAKVGYNSFVIERAAEGESIFRRTNRAPFINSDNDKEIDFHYVDSLPANGIKYSFRIRGVDAFGELSPPSEIVSGFGYKNVQARASIIDAFEKTNGVVQVSWNITGDVSTIKELKVQRSDKADGKYSTINTRKLNAASRSYDDEKALSTSYYRINLLGEQDSVLSFPYLVQLLDSIPPQPPVGLAAMADTSGIVHISWTPNKERDLLGYRVFRSNFLNHEFSQITSEPVQESNFIDTVELTSMTRVIYYRIAAVDKRHNPSGYSEVFKLNKPDVVPPAAPGLKSIKQNGINVEIYSFPSPSTDVAKVSVMTKATNANEWRTAKELHPDSIHFLVPVTSLKGMVEFKLVAVDSAGNSSLDSRSFTVNLITPQRSALKDISYSVDREQKLIAIQWNSEEKDVAKFIVYRGEEMEPLSLYNSVVAPSNGFHDRSLKMNTSYRYRIKMIFRDGSESLFSKEINVKF